MYGFAIHGCIDGYSRRIMWLEVNPSNNDPLCVSRYFVDCVQSCQGKCSRLSGANIRFVILLVSV